MAQVKPCLLALFKRETESSFDLEHSVSVLTCVCHGNFWQFCFQCNWLVNHVEVEQRSLPEVKGNWNNNNKINCVKLLLFCCFKWHEIKFS